MDINKLLNEFAEEVLLLVKQILISKKIASNSNLVRTLDVQVTPTAIDIYANHYIVFLDTGRRAGAKKVPISALLTWIKQKGFNTRSGQSLNQLAFAIQTSIYKAGIAGKHFLKQIEDSVTFAWNNFVDNSLINELTKDIDVIMNKK